MKNPNTYIRQFFLKWQNSTISSAPSKKFQGSDELLEIGPKCRPWI